MMRTYIAGLILLFITLVVVLIASWPQSDVKVQAHNRDSIVNIAKPAIQIGDLNDTDFSNRITVMADNRDTAFRPYGIVDNMYNTIEISGMLDGQRVWITVDLNEKSRFYGIIFINYY